ncbi:hypothetical protein J6590_063712 [Homalodisca vitripennis]|nr:hypothetical protein J6590_063712 [Homalodisca vitripennis]
MPSTPVEISNSGEDPRKTELDKWNECYKSGRDLFLGGLALGSCASIITLTPFPFLVLSGIGLYSAVENCDYIFKKQIKSELDNSGATKSSTHNTAIVGKAESMPKLSLAPVHLPLMCNI